MSPLPSRGGRASRGGGCGGADRGAFAGGPVGPDRRWAWRRREPGGGAGSEATGPASSSSDDTSSRGGGGYLVWSRMPQLPVGETYQLWGLIQGRTISLGLLGRRPTEAAFTVASSAPSTLLVTVEPAGGVLAPDRAPTASGSVATT